MALMGVLHIIDWLHRLKSYVIVWAFLSIFAVVSGMALRDGRLLMWYYIMLFGGTIYYGRKGKKK